MTFPTTIPTITPPASTDYLDSAGVVHDTLHDTEIAEILALEAKVGVDSSAVTSSHDYKIAHHQHTGADGSVQGTLAAALSDVVLASVIDGQAIIYDAASSKWKNVAAEHRLATIAGVDLNTATPTTLYTVPAGRTAIITRIVLRLASTSLTTASISFGWTSAAFNDVIANATHTELTGNTLYTVLVPKVGALIGVAAAVLKVLANTLQGAACTITCDIFGYEF